MVVLIPRIRASYLALLFMYRKANLRVWDWNILRCEENDSSTSLLLTLGSIKIHHIEFLRCELLISINPKYILIKEVNFKRRRILQGHVS